MIRLTVRHMAAAAAALIAAALTGATARDREVPSDIPAVSSVVTGYDTCDEVRRRMADMPLDRVEGLWHIGVPGVTLAVERGSLPGSAGKLYRMVCVSTPGFDIEPGTVLGYLLPAPVAGSYDAYMYSGYDSGTGMPCTPRRFDISTDGDASQLSFVEVHNGYRLTFGRIFSRIFHLGIRREDTRPRGHEGCVRIYPRPRTSSSGTTVYL